MMPWYDRIALVFYIALGAAIIYMILNPPYALGRDIPRPIVIDLDYGGSLDDHLRWFERVRDAGVPVRVEGVCISACTFVLMLPHDQVCITPKASLGFHLVSTNGIPDPSMTWAFARRYYPQPIQDWLAKQPPLKLLPITFMDAPTIVGLRVFPYCA